MGLLDKAKEIQKEEGLKEAPAEKKEIEEPAPGEGGEKKKESAAAPTKKKTKPTGKKKRPSAKKVKGKKPSISLKAPSISKPKKARKKEKIPEEPPIVGLPEDLEFAPLTHRILAQVFDGVILAVAIILLFVGIVMALGGEMIAVLIAMILYLILPIGYFYYFLGTKDGVTPGKSYFHVKVVSLDGKPLTSTKVMGTAIWNGLLYPILNIVDAVLGIFILHKDTQQRMSQEKDDLIVITVKKKKAFYSAIDSVANAEGSTRDEAETPAEE